MRNGCGTIIAIFLMIGIVKAAIDAIAANLATVGMVVIGIIIITILAKISKTQHERKRVAQRESHRQESEHIASGNRSIAEPLIQKFIASYLPSGRPWPPPAVDIPELDCEALKTIVRQANTDPNQLYVNQHGYFRRFSKIVIDELVEKEIQRRFSVEFLNRNPKLSGEIWINRLTFRYVHFFENDMRYIPHLAQLAVSQGLVGDGAEQIVTQQVEEEINNRAHRRRVESVQKAMDKGVADYGITIDMVDEMDGLAFERLLGRLFQAMGYIATVTKASGDQGADLVVEKMGERTAVQAKRYADPVSNKAVQEVVAAKQLYSCHNAIVVTNSTFNRSAVDLAKANGVMLWDRSKLEALLGMYV